MFVCLLTCFVPPKRNTDKDLSLVEWQMMVQWLEAKNSWVITTPMAKEIRNGKGYWKSQGSRLCEAAQHSGTTDLVLRTQAAQGKLPREGGRFITFLALLSPFTMTSCQSCTQAEANQIPKGNGGQLIYSINVTLPEKIRWRK